MRKLVHFMGSLELTLVLMLLVAVWFSLGALLSVSSQYGNSIRLLNDQLAGQSLFGLGQEPMRIVSYRFDSHAIQQEILGGYPSRNFTVVTWLWIALGIGFLLGVNLILGSREWFFDLFAKRLDFRKTLLFAMHLLFAVVLVGHLISFFFGFKAVGDIPLRQGQTTEFGPYGFRIDEVVAQSTAGGPAVRQGPVDLRTPDQFVFQNVAVNYTLLEDGTVVKTGRLESFHPVTYKNITIALAPFSYRSQVSFDFRARGMSQQVTIYANPGLPVMVLFQPIWILIILVYIIYVVALKR